MGLVERIQEARAKIAADTADLKNLLKIVGAREQLAEVKKAWGVGEIDKKSTEILERDPLIRTAIQLMTLYRTGHTRPLEDESLPLPKPPAMALALRCHFLDTEETMVDTWTIKKKGTLLCISELSLQTVVGFAEGDLPYVATIYGYQSAPYSKGSLRFYEDGKRYYHGNMTARNLCIASKSPEMIFPADPDKSRQVLKQQLFEIYSKNENFLDLENQAREKILSDDHLPGQVRSLVSPRWYKRLPAKIVDPILNPASLF